MTAPQSKHLRDQATEDVRNFGKMLGIALESLSMTKVELAETIETDSTTIGRIVHGTNPKLTTAVSICRAIARKNKSLSLLLMQQVGLADRVKPSTIADYNGDGVEDIKDLPTCTAEIISLASDLMLKTLQVISDNKVTNEEAVEISNIYGGLQNLLTHHNYLIGKENYQTLCRRQARRPQ